MDSYPTLIFRPESSGGLVKAVAAKHVYGGSK